MDQCKKILQSQGNSIWSHLGSSQKTMDTQKIDANVAFVRQSPNPKLQNPKWRR